MSALDFLGGLVNLILEGAYLKEELRGSRGSDGNADDLRALMRHAADQGRADGITQINARALGLGGALLVADELTDLPDLDHEPHGQRAPTAMHRRPSAHPALAEYSGIADGKDVDLAIVPSTGWAFIIRGGSPGEADTLNRILIEALTEQLER